MSSSGVYADSVSEALDALAAALNIEMPIAMLESGEQNAAAERYEALLRRAHFRAVGIVKALDDSRAAADVGATSTSTLLQHRLRLSPAEAGARVRAARALCPGQTLTGEPIPPRLPVVAEAAEQGQISGTHVDVIERTIRDLPDDLDPGVRDSVERDMVTYAKQFEPQGLRRIGNAISIRLNPKDPDPEKNRTRRGLIFGDDDLPGLIRISGRCTADTAAIIQTALDPLAKPRPEVEGVKDLRTHSQRTIDALEELACRELKSGTATTQVTISGTTDALAAGVGQLPWVGPTALNSAGWMLCDTTIRFIETDEHGVPVKISTPQRTIPHWLRQTVFARDKGCAFPGCTRPVGWADIHHVTPWEQRKEHQLDNLVTLCGFHHRLVHVQRWQISFINRIPHFTPPRWIDSAQRPIRNYVHRVTRNRPLRT